VDIFFWGGGDIFSNEIGFDGEFAMSAVDEDGELDTPGPAEIVQGIHGGADGATAEEDVIDEDYGFAGDVEGDNGGENVWSGTLVEVIAVHADVEAACGDGVGPDVGEEPA
jgi:hypothetical protein